MEKDAETELEKNNRNSGNDLLYSKHAIQGEKTLPYIRGSESKEHVTQHVTTNDEQQHLSFYFACFAYNWTELESLFISYSVIG